MTARFRSRSPILARVTITTLLALTSMQGQNASPGSMAGSRIIAPAPSHTFPDGQRLIFLVEWHRLNAGTATMLLGKSERAEHLLSTADSAGFVNKIFPVHDTFQADIDPRTFCTTQIAKHNEEGSRRLDRKIYFDYSQLKSKVDDNDLKSGKRKHAEFDIPVCVTDVVSGFFYVGSLNLLPGYTQTFPVNDGGKTTDVQLQVEAREQVKVPAGTFSAIRVRGEPINGSLKGTIWVWFSDDGRRIPVQMKSKLGFATLMFQLQRIETPTGAK